MVAKRGRILKRKNKLKVVRRKMTTNEEERQFRSSMAAILSAMEAYGAKLTDRHLDAMKRTPFYMLLNAFREGVVSLQDIQRGESLTADIVQLFDPTTRKFKLGGREVCLTSNDVRLIFGIVDGKLPIKLFKGTKPEWNFYHRWFANDVYLNPKVVKEKLHVVFSRKKHSDVDVEDAVRLLCLLLFTTLFVPLKGFSLTWGWVEFVEDLDSMRSYDWSGIILSRLIGSLVAKHGNPYKVVGCTMVLHYWLCEHTTVYNARDCAEALPRFVRWQLTGLKTVVTRNMLMTLEAEKVVVGDLVPTDVELAILRSLKEYGCTNGSPPMSANKKQRKIADKAGPSRRARVDVKGKMVEDGSAVTKGDELESLAYSALVADHADLQVKYKQLEEESLHMKEKVSGLVHDSTSKDAELDTYKEKIMTLNVELFTAVGETDELSGKYVERGLECDALRKRVMVLEKELAAEKEKNRFQAAHIDDLNDRWFAAMEPEIHAITQAACAEMDKSTDEADDNHPCTNGKDVKAIIEASGELEKSGDEPGNGQNSMIKRLKGKTRKPVVIDDDFEFDRLFVKRSKTDKEPLRFKNNADFLAYLDRHHRGHCGRFLPPAVVTKLVDTINLGPREIFYYNKDRQIIVDVPVVMDVFKGGLLGTFLVDAYGHYLVKTMDPVKSKRTISIISGHCWEMVVKRNCERLINEVIGASLRNTGLILMPMLSTGNTEEVGVNHWTLLVMDVDDQEWRFYNSKRPRTGRTVDKYWRDAKLLKEKLEIAMAGKTSSSLGHKVLKSAIHRDLVHVPVPSQGDSCDCAIFVCYFMRQLVRDGKLKMTMGGDMVRKFKAEVVQSIIMP